MFIASFVGAHKGMKRAQKKKQKKDERKYLEPEEENKSDEKWSTLQGQLKASRRILQTWMSPTISKDKLVPKQVISKAKGIIFLTVYKLGALVGFVNGNGLLIIRQKETNWSLPISIDIMDMSMGIIGKGGSFNKHTYMFIINSDKIIQDFIKTNTLKFDKQKVYPGPIGRDTDLKYFQSSDIYCYPNINLQGFKITFAKKVNNKYYDLKDVTMENILAATDHEKDENIIKIPQNDHYDKIIYLLDMYCISKNDAFQHNVEHEVNMNKINDLKDEDVENCVNILHSIFKDIDCEVIKIILMKQCFGNMRDCVEILCKMTSDKNIDKDKVEKDIDATKFEKEKLIEIAKNHSENHLSLSSSDEDDHNENDKNENQKKKGNLSISPSALMIDGLLNKFDI